MEYLTLFTVVALFSIGIVFHLLRIIWLAFKPAFLAKFNSITTESPGRWQLFLYYTLALLTLLSALLSKLGIVAFRLFT